MPMEGTYGEVIAHAIRDFRERVGGAGRDEDDVGPASYFYVKDGISNLVSRLLILSVRY
jgi:hypothetical protein